MEKKYGILSDKSKHAIVYDSMRCGFWGISKIFFKEIETSGTHLVPSKGPCIFIVGPHANQFVDPILVSTSNPRRSFSLIAAKSYERPLFGRIAKIQQAIPVIRPQDLVYTGNGTIFLDSFDPTLVRGNFTLFTKQLSSRFFLILSKTVKLEVVEVISDTAVRIRQEVEDQPTLSALKDGGGIRYKIMPYVDQKGLYKRVNEKLSNGDCITIFPEGGSHDRTELLPLKAGFAIMALDAMANDPSIDVKIIPIGLNYFHPDQFRSRAVVSFGQPILIARAEVEKYKAGGVQKREAVTNLIRAGRQALMTVTVNSPDYETLKVAQAARRLYRPVHHKLSISQVVDLNRRFMIGFTELRDQPELQDLLRQVQDYNQTLAQFGIRDHQVERLNLTPFQAARLLIARVLKLSSFAILAIPSAIMNLPIIALCRYISKRKQKFALAESSVKITGKDVVATWKIIVACFAAPALYAGYSLLYFVYLSRRYPSMSRRRRTIRAVISWAIQPILHYSLMRCGETGIATYRSIKPLFLAIADPNASKRIKEMRAGLSENITKLVQSRGPAIFEDFDDAQRSRKEEKKPIAKHSNTDRLHNRHLDWLDDSSIFNWRGDQSDMDSDDDVFEIFEKRRANRAEPSPLRTMSPIMSQPAPSTSTPMHPTQEVVSNSGRKPRTRTTSLGAGLAEGFNVRKMSQLSRTKSFQEISAALSSGVDLMESPTIETR
ncbi:Glycerol-3-phosphate/dihydroxyacetone phosphate acyltransferase [Umbelopsis sp. WA50703]